MSENIKYKWHKFDDTIPEYWIEEIATRSPSGKIEILRKGGLSHWGYFLWSHSDYYWRLLPKSKKPEKPKKSKWHKFPDEKPPVYVPILCFTGAKIIVIDIYKGINADREWADHSAVLYWRYLPKPPKE